MSSYGSFDAMAAGTGQSGDMGVFNGSWGKPGTLLYREFSDTRLDPVVVAAYNENLKKAKATLEQAVTTLKKNYTDDEKQLHPGSIRVLEEKIDAGVDMLDAMEDLQIFEE